MKNQRRTVLLRGGSVCSLSTLIRLCLGGYGAALFLREEASWASSICAFRVPPLTKLCFCPNLWFCFKSIFPPCFSSPSVSISRRRCSQSTTTCSPPPSRPSGPRSRPATSPKSTRCTSSNGCPPTPRTLRCSKPGYCWCDKFTAKLVLRNFLLLF